MKKAVVSVLISCMVVGGANAAELQRAAGQKSPQGFVLVGMDGRQEDLADALGEVHQFGGAKVLPLAQVDEALSVVQDLGDKIPVRNVLFDDGKDKSMEDQFFYWMPSLRDCKHGVAGALVGGYAAGLIQSSYGTPGGIAFSILTSAIAVAVAVNSKEDSIFVENKHLVCGFVSGTYLPFMGTVFFRKRK